MKLFALGTAFLAMTSYATPVMSQTSFGGHTKATVEAMKVFCDQSIKDHKATNEPVTGALLKLCGTY